MNLPADMTIETAAWMRTQMTTHQKAVAGFKVASGIGVAVGVTGAMVAPAIRQAMGYNLRLAHLANTGYNDRDKAGRAAGARSLDADIIDAVKYGGGTRDGAMTVAEKLYGAGQFKPNEIKSILRDAVRGGTANDADAGLLSEMATKVNKTMGIAPNQMGRLFSIATYAGQSGGFELKDMAKHLPSQKAVKGKLRLEAWATSRRAPSLAKCFRTERLCWVCLVS